MDDVFEALGGQIFCHGEGQRCPAREFRRDPKTGGLYHDTGGSAHWLNGSPYHSGTTPAIETRIENLLYESQDLSDTLQRNKVRELIQQAIDVIKP
jgi:hypothetical protein